MRSVASRCLVLVCCLVAAASAAQDHVLRFLSHEETIQMAQEKQSQHVTLSPIGNGKEHLEMEEFRAQSTVCPGGVTQCPDSTTCCPLRNGEYGCCDGANAVCCKDGVHCCPEGFRCDEQHSQCASDTLGIAFRWADQKVVRAQPAPHVGPNTTCPDNKTVCQRNDTCCSATKGHFGCCPLHDAVCCSDRLHCCPRGSKCDVVHRRCYRQEDDWQQPWVEGHPGVEQTGVSDVVCPGGKSKCPNGNTCCQLTSGQWGCCPHPNAVCCSDHLHCCPHGYKCDVAAGACNKSGDDEDFLPWDVKQPAVPRKKAESVVCPDQSVCEDGQTCCKLTGGNYGCCPYPKAVCCSDGKHCCPSGYTCNLPNQTCDKGITSVALLEKIPTKSSVQSVICPGGKEECPNGSTCCKLNTGQYGCCPRANAVCCSDGLHCCPEGTTCDLVKQSCKKGLFSIPWGKKLSAQHREWSVPCPGGQSQCPDGTTCCKLKTGQYGCCPMPDAVCCRDRVHCCPSGYTCDLEKQACTKGQHSVSWVEKQPAQHSIP